MSKKILVTGATGTVAGSVIPQLLEGGATVHLYVRTKEKAKHFADKGAVLFEGDFNNQEALNKAAEGVDAVLAITPAGPEAIVQGNAILSAAQKSGSPHYVRLSAIGAAPDAPTENGKLHYESDKAVINSGLTYTILRPHYFMQNSFMSVESLKAEGKMYLGMGDGKLGLVDTRDIADSFASILLNGGHGNMIYTPTGPESISFSRIAEIMSEAGGSPVEYVPIPIEAVGDFILKAGWGEWGAQVMMDYSKAYSEGWGNFTNDDVKIVTGKDARSFKTFYEGVLSHAL
ncbi:MAG TPA: SDR family oxidoreductase [Bacteroides sp.]|nr:SDR family oxidoreductase [Bacteroides sp.]